jgi:hypothetical protein
VEAELPWNWAGVAAALEPAAPLKSEPTPEPHAEVVADEAAEATAEAEAEATAEAEAEAKAVAKAVAKADAVAEADAAAAAFRTQAIQREKQARVELQEQQHAATQMQAVQRGRQARLEREEQTVGRAFEDGALLRSFEAHVQPVAVRTDTVGGATGMLADFTAVCRRPTCPPLCRTRPPYCPEVFEYVGYKTYSILHTYAAPCRSSRRRASLLPGWSGRR